MDKKEDNKTKEQERIALKEEWDTIPFAQIIGGLIKKINESFRQIQYGNWPNSSLIETKMKDLTHRTSKIKNQIERITKEKKKVTPEIYINTNNINNIIKFESPNFFPNIKKQKSSINMEIPLFSKFIHSMIIHQSIIIYH
uniref:Uncharacterized protein n=1 Tax=Solanum lycopersicum TaxID=4081 RepID=K4B4I3_SOLLC